jgi:hypothetical protein
MSNFIIQSIIIKNKPLKDALEIAFSISKKLLLPDFKPNSIRFRVEEPSKFLKNSFRTKKITDNISIIFGKYKKKYENQMIDGGALTLYDYNNISKRTLNLYGNNKIVRMDIVRAPISNFINKFLDVISIGKFNELKKKYGFDKFFHLQLLLTLDNGKNVSVEKNEQIYIKDKVNIKKDSEFLEVPLKGKNITLNELLDKTKNTIGPRTYFDYNSFTNNCQFYIKYILEINGLLNNENKEFLFQDVNEILAGLPSYVPAVANLATKSASLVSLFTGRGCDYDSSESEEDDEYYSDEY